MATHDYVLANQSGSSFRTDLNNALAAVVSNNSNATEPSTKYAYELWADTNSGYLKIRNAANNGWVSLFKLDGTDIHFVNLSGSTNNTVCTVTGADAIQGEANLTFDGTSLVAETTIKVQGGSGDTLLNLHRTNAAGSDGNNFGAIKWTDNNSNEVASIRGQRATAVDDADITFLTRQTGGSASQRMVINSLGNVGIGVDPPMDEAVLHIKDSSTGGYRPLIVEGSATAGASIVFFNQGAARISIGSAGANVLTGSSSVDGCIRTEGNMLFAVGNSQKAKIDSSGHLTIADGDLVIGTAGHGIDFSAQTASSATGATTSDENLDHYEYGTWTPVSPTLTFTENAGHYIRIGRSVMASMRFRVPSNSSSNYLMIDGLPFNCQSYSGYYRNGGYVMYSGYGAAAGVLVHDNGDRTQLYTTSGNSITLTSVDDVEFRIQVHYFVA